MRSRTRTRIGVPLTVALLGSLAAPAAQGAGLSLATPVESVSLPHPTATTNAPPPVHVPPGPSALKIETQPAVVQAGASGAQPSVKVSLNPTPPARVTAPPAHLSAPPASTPAPRIAQATAPTSGRGARPATGGHASAAYAGAAMNRPTSSRPLPPATGSSRGPGAGTGAQLSAASSQSRAHTAALPLSGGSSSPPPAVPGHTSPPKAGHTPSASVPAAVRHAQAGAPERAHTNLPDSPLPEPLRGLLLRPESGEALQLALIALAAMLLLCVLFADELRVGDRFRALLERRAPRPPL
jgi:hypothetical protein